MGLATCTFLDKFLGVLLHSWLVKTDPNNPSLQGALAGMEAANAVVEFVQYVLHFVAS